MKSSNSELFFHARFDKAFYKLSCDRWTRKSYTFIFNSVYNHKTKNFEYYIPNFRDE